MSFERKWYAHKSHQTFYAVCKKDGRQVKMHREIMQCPFFLEIDHINRNGLDNRKINLRQVTTAENLQNKRPYKNNKSGTPGVFYLDTGRGQKHWNAQFTRDGKQHFLGRFLTKEEAIAARLEAERVYANS
jgi:hypothetical protein